MPPQRPGRVYETVLYATDLRTCAGFYADVLGLAEIGGLAALGAAFRLDDGGMLLLFDPEAAGAPGRPIPAHGTTGPGHVALGVGPGALDAWAEELRGVGVAVEREVSWPAGGRSLYVRDPAGNSVELTEGEAWPPRPE